MIIVPFSKIFETVDQCFDSHFDNFANSLPFLFVDNQFFRFDNLQKQKRVHWGSQTTIVWESKLFGFIGNIFKILNNCAHFGVRTKLKNYGHNETSHLVLPQKLMGSQQSDCNFVNRRQCFHYLFDFGRILFENKLESLLIKCQLPCEFLDLFDFLKEMFIIHFNTHNIVVFTCK